MSNLHAFTMPKWGIEMTEGSIAEWLVAEAASFSKGDALVAIETDKIVNEVEADFDSVCLRIVAEPDVDYKVGSLLAVFGSAGTAPEDIDAFIAAFKPSEAFADQDSEPEPVGSQGIEASAESLQPQPPQQPDYQLPSGIKLSAAAQQFASRHKVDLASLNTNLQDGRLNLQDVQQHHFAKTAVASVGSPVDNKVAEGEQAVAHATPVALRLAAANGLSLDGIVGTGKYGRIRRRDLGLQDTPTLAPGEVVKTPFSRMRGHIAERLTRSHREIPHYYLQAQANVDELVAQRDVYNESSDEHATINDVIMLATARALRANPAVNINVVDNAVVQFGDVNVAIAVAIEDGLITPVLRTADHPNLPAVSREARRLIDGARSGKLSLAEYGKGTFTVSNLGMHGINEFTSIINPPQAAILSVGMFQRVPFEVNGGVEFGWQVSLTLACDHRAIDGTVGTKMLASLKRELESPAVLFRV